MAVYRVSEEGQKRMVSRAGWEALPIAGAILLVVILIGGFNMGWGTIAEIWYVYLIVGIALVFMSRRRQQSSMKKAAAVICVVLDDDALSVDVGLTQVSIPRRDVTSIRDTKAGTYVRGRDFKSTVLLLRDLENYEELRVRLNAWAPADVPKGQGRHIFGLMPWLPALASIALFAPAFIVSDPVIGPILCVTTAVVLIGLMVMVVRSKFVDARTKRMMFAAHLPVLALLQRAHTLWTGSNLER